MPGRSRAPCLRAIGPPRARTRPEQMRGRDAHLPLDRLTPIGPFVATAESGPRSRVTERETGLRVSRLGVGVVLLMAGASLLGSTSASGAVMTYVVNSTDDEANASPTSTVCASAGARPCPPRAATPGGNNKPRPATIPPL